MTEKKKPKVIILESNDAVRKHVKEILSEEGWDVFSESVSKNALDLLAESKNYLFALFVCNFKLPKMEGDDILQKVKSISPFTQRMMMVPADKPGTLISAINKAEINACIMVPFDGNDLVNQAKSCFRQFKKALKRQKLKRVTVHQNKKMFQIAQNLKKKDESIKNSIAEKKTQKVSLRLKKRELKNKSESIKDISLANFIEQKKITPDPEAYKKEFLRLCKTIKGLSSIITNRHRIDPLTFNIRDILNPQINKETAPDADVEGADTPEEQQDTPDDQNQETSIEDDSGSKEAEEQGPVPKALIENILKVAISDVIKRGTSESEDSAEPDGIDDFFLDDENIFSEYIKISISKDQIKAWVERIKPPDKKCPELTVTDLMDMLMQRQISHGIIDDEAIEAWISKPSVDKIIIASGEAPDLGSDGKIDFCFETNFTNPGKINEDGTIDFRDRGDIPYVKKGDLLATKTPARDSRAGISISGTPIPVDEVNDPVFVAGPGTEMSEDELNIHAAIDGQPHLDAMGTISVNPELVIPGDVDFETGNIEFKGNIIVKGMIKEGFKVKGINLTVQEIEGGTIDLSGDLNVSAGITESTISVHGNIYAKFINHSSVMGFGDLNISKEIIDSDILLSGSCQNQTGHILSSKITAKLGIEAGKIGTSSSKPATLKVGVDEHLEKLKEKINENLQSSIEKVKLLKDEIQKLEDEDQELYQQISEKAHIQDRAQIEIKKFKTSLPELEKAKDVKKVSQVSKKIKDLAGKAKAAEKDLSAIFENQDKIAKGTEQLKDQINKMEEKNKALVTEKKAIKEFAKKQRPVSVITVAKTITQDTVVRGANASIILKEDKSRCRIIETGQSDNDTHYYEMIISDL